jgi:hypothetical protein
MSSASEHEQSEEELEGLPSNPMVESQLERFKVTEQDVKILVKHREIWQAKKGKERTAIAIKAYDKILAAHSDLERGNSKEGKKQRQLIREVNRPSIGIVALIT